MLLIPCPWCGERPESEFTCAGEVTAARPRDPGTVSDAAWADFITLRANVRGLHAERWWHVRGCGTWFVIRRDTVTHEIHPEGGAP